MITIVGKRRYVNKILLMKVKKVKLVTTVSRL